VRAGILGGAGLALGSARAGALGRVGAVGRELLIGNRHKSNPFDSQIAPEIEKSTAGSGKSRVGKELVFELAVNGGATVRHRTG
jgi:hypothetical protein